MSLQPNAAWTLAQEARALLTRLDRVKPLVLTMPMVPAAAPSTETLDAVAADALRLRRGLYPVPPVVTYVDRGHGAAIRRALASNSNRQHASAASQARDAVAYPRVRPTDEDQAYRDRGTRSGACG